MILPYGIEESEDSGQEWGVLDISQMSPYQQDEPLADVDDETVLMMARKLTPMDSLLPFWKRDMREL